MRRNYNACQNSFSSWKQTEWYKNLVLQLPLETMKFTLSSYFHLKIARFLAVFIITEKFFLNFSKGVYFLWKILLLKQQTWFIFGNKAIRHDGNCNSVCLWVFSMVRLHRKHCPVECKVFFSCTAAPKSTMRTVVD